MAQPAFQSAAACIPVKRVARLVPEIAPRTTALPCVGKGDGSNYGRYVAQPAVADALGVATVPPPPVSPWMKMLIVKDIVSLLVVQVMGRRAD